jgi:hypothetical protein
MASAVELVQAGLGQRREIADVVDPCRGFEQVGVWAEDGCNTASACGDALDMCPASGECGLQERAGEVSGPGGKRLHGFHVRGRAAGRSRTWRAVWRRLNRLDLLKSHAESTNGLESQDAAP